MLTCFYSISKFINISRMHESSPLTFMTITIKHTCIPSLVGFVRKANAVLIFNVCVFTTHILIKKSVMDA